MKKNIFVLLLALVMTFAFVSCSMLGAVLGSTEAIYVPYVLEESSDIYGDHVKTAVTVDRQTEGLAASTFTVRFIENRLNGEVENYGLLFREQDNLSNDGYYYMTMFPLIRVDGEVFEFPLAALPEYTYAGDIRFKEVEVRLPNAAVEALRNAEEVVVQYYSVNDQDKLVELTPEGVQAIKDLINGVSVVQE